MKVLGIGNAIVDVICKVNENFISQNNLTKSNMKLIFDEDEFKNLLSNLKIEKTVSGGSVANSIVGLSQFCCNKQEDANGFCEAFSLCIETQSH